MQWNKRRISGFKLSRSAFIEKKQTLHWTSRNGWPFSNNVNAGSLQLTERNVIPEQLAWLFIWQRAENCIHNLRDGPCFFWREGGGWTISKRNLRHSQQSKNCRMGKIIKGVLLTILVLTEMLAAKSNNAQPQSRRENIFCLYVVIAIQCWKQRKAVISKYDWHFVRTCSYIRRH